MDFNYPFMGILGIVKEVLGDVFQDFHDLFSFIGVFHAICCIGTGVIVVWINLLLESPDKHLIRIRTTGMIMVPVMP